jgi:LAO/AO transport system kinase
LTSPELLAERILAGDIRALARAASLVESQGRPGRALLKLLFPHTGRALILGITGPPGAGKSTLVSALSRLLRAQGKTVGIIGIDPSSPFSRGALLGDRIRMQEHHADEGVFIRSMATRGNLGGLASASFEMALLIDAAGRDVIIIETVGVGQDEIDISRMADVTLLVLVPGMGDDVQAIKAGIMEVADIFVINKADLAGADRLKQEICAMQSLAERPHEAEHAPIVPVIAAEGGGVDKLLEVAFKIAHGKARQRNEAGLWAYRLREMLRQKLLCAVPQSRIEEIAEEVAKREIDPFSATELLASLILGD